MMVSGDDNVVQLIEVNQKNIFKVLSLSKTLDDYQQTCVASNAVSLAQAYVSPQAWPRAIDVDGEIVGFVMLSLDDSDVDSCDQPAYYLWRFMIAKSHQGKGYGKKVLDLIVEKAKADGRKYLYTSCEMSGKMPFAFYTSYGFIDTHVVDEGEEVLKLKLD